MGQKTKTIPNWLLWIVWILAGLCVAAVIGLAIMIAGSVREEEPEVTETSTLQQQEEETQQQEEQEPTLPILNLQKNPYAEEDFDYHGRYLECISGPCRIGIDVSAWQNEVDWKLVQASGMEFAMIRLAWRGSTEGGIRADDYAAANYRGAKDAGLEVGGYVFSQAVTPEEAVEEAQFVIEMMQEWKMDLPIVFDWEQTWDRTANVSARTLTDCALAFCQTMEEAGYDAMIYFNPHMAYNNIYLEELDEYGFWLAMYDAPMTFPYQIDMWQYTQNGSVLGVEGSVDLNILFEY